MKTLVQDRAALDSRAKVVSAAAKPAEVVGSVTPDDWIDRLPPLMRPEHASLHLLVEDPRAIAFMESFRSARHKAEAAYWDFAKAEGAAGYWPPNDPGSAITPSLFAFEEKPTNKAWKVLARRAKDTAFKAHPNAKNDAGKALLARCEALPPYPMSKVIAERIGAISSISYASLDGSSHGSSCVGSGFMPTVGLEWAGDTFLLRVSNPMKTLAEIVGRKNWTIEHGEEKTAPKRRVWGIRYNQPPTPDVAGWRPSGDFKLISEAERDLIFAQFRFEQEKKKAASA